MIFQKELDDILSEFSKKFINPKLDYWNIVNKLNSDGFMDSVYMQIYSDIGVNWVP